MLKNIAIIGLFSIALSGCLKGSTADMCNYDPCALKATVNEEQAVEVYLENNNIVDAVRHCSGLYYVIETLGTGKTPQVCDRIIINYEGRLTNGQVFDKSTNPVTFELNELIPGWKNALPLIKEGGRLRLFVPPTLGYGNQDRRDRNGNIVIPGGSILIFDVELKQIQ